MDFWTDLHGKCSLVPASKQPEEFYWNSIGCYQEGYISEQEMTPDLTFKQEKQHGREENIINATVGRQQVTVSLKSEELVASIQNTVKCLKSSRQKCGFTSAGRQTSVSQRAISVWEYLRVKEGKHVKLDEASDNTGDTAETGRCAMFDSLRDPAPSASAGRRRQLMMMTTMTQAAFPQNYVVEITKHGDEMLCISFSEDKMTCLRLTAT